MVVGELNVTTKHTFFHVDKKLLQLCFDLKRLHALETKVQALTDMLAPLLASESYREAQEIIKKEN